MATVLEAAFAAQEKSAEEILALVQAQRALNILMSEQRFERMAPWDLDMELSSSKISRKKMAIVMDDLDGYHAITKARVSNIKASAARTARK